MMNEEGDVPGISKRRRILVLRIAEAILLALVALLVLVPPLRDKAVSLFTQPTATAIAPAVASEITATAEAQAWSTLQRRPLHLPSVIPGTTCPVSPVHSIYYAGSVPGLALGSSPVYAAGGGRAPSFAMRMRIRSARVTARGAVRRCFGLSSQPTAVQY